jgi:hypothetical protein
VGIRTSVDDGVNEVKTPTKTAIVKDGGDGDRMSPQFERALDKMALLVEAKVSLQNGGFPWPDVRPSFARRILNWLHGTHDLN